VFADQLIWSEGYDGPEFVTFSRFVPSSFKRHARTAILVGPRRVIKKRTNRSSWGTV
jgi:hypothetical protein